MKSPSVPAAAQRICGKWGAGGAQQWLLLVDASGNAKAGVSTSAVKIDTGAAVSNNAWHHILLLLSAGTVYTYVDGTPSAGTAAAGNLTTSTSSLDIGQALTNPLDGELAHLAVWASALTSDEIAALAKGASPLNLRHVPNLYLPLGWAGVNERNLVGSETFTNHGSTIVTDGPAVAPPRIWLPRANKLAGGQTITLGQAGESDTPRPLTAAKTIALGPAGVSETPRPLAVAKTIALGPAAASETPRPLTVTTTVQLGAAAETETPRALTVTKVVALGVAGSHETPRALTISGPATHRLGRVTETETARPLTVAKTIALGRAGEAATVRPVVVSRTVKLGRAGEAAAVRPLTHTRTVTLGRAGESDTVRALRVIIGAIAAAPITTRTRTGGPGSGKTGAAGGSGQTRTATGPGRTSTTLGGS